MRFAPLSAALVLVSMALASRPAGAADGEPSFVPALRIGFGPSVHLSPKADKGTDFAIDATLGGSFWVPLKRRAGLVLGAEAGFAHDADANAFNFALGIGAGHPAAYVAYHPRLLAGSSGGSALLGMRNGIAMHVLWDMGSLEIAHEMTHYADAWHQAVKFMFAVNPAAFVFALMKL